MQILQFILLQLLYAVCLAACIGPTLWMFRRGWRAWSGIYAGLIGVPIALMPLFAVVYFPITSIWLELLSTIFSFVTVLACFALLGPAAKGIGPLSARKEVGRSIVRMIDKRTYPIVIFLPAAGVYFALISLGIKDGSALTTSCYVAGVCIVFGPYVVPTRKDKAIRNYGSLSYIKRTATKPVVVTLIIIQIVSTVVTYLLGATIGQAPLIASGVVLAVWRWTLRPIRKGEFDFEFEGEMSYWRAVDYQKVEAEKAKLVDTVTIKEGIGDQAGGRLPDPTHYIS